MHPESSSLLIELESLLSRDVDELYMLIAAADPAWEGMFFAPDEARRHGQMSFARVSAAVKHRVCTDWDYCARRDDPRLSDNVALAAALCDVIVGVVGGLPAASIAALLVKKGLGSWCGCDG